MLHMFLVWMLVLLGLGAPVLAPLFWLAAVAVFIMRRREVQRIKAAKRHMADEAALKTAGDFFRK